MINMITERKFPDYPINYEKMQVYKDGEGADYNMLCDADMLIHPHFPDVATIVKPENVAFNDNYNISHKYYADRIKYFVRDGRDVGIATNFVVTSSLTHDLWEPLPLTQEQISELAVPNDSEPDEWNRGWGHYADEFAFNGPAWSISVEMFLYFTFSVMFFLNKRFFLIMPILFVMLFILFLTDTYGEGYYHGAFFSGLYSFSIGCIFCYIYFTFIWICYFYTRNFTKTCS